MTGLLFSEEDRDLAKLNWHKHPGGYAIRWHGPRSSRKKTLSHRIVLERKIGRPLKSNELCDHINRNKLDNRRENLRVADKSLNSINRDIRPDNTSGYIGVYLHWPKEHQKKGWAKRWAANIFRNGATKNIGYFKSPEEAHKARENYLVSNQLL